MVEVKKPSQIHFVKVGKGRLALFHRPRHDTFATMRKMGGTHVVTLLKDIEDAEHYGNMAREAGLTWIWVPVPNGKYPEGEVHKRLIAAMPELSRLLDEGKSLLIHCSAGVHRTGTVAYGLLRYRGVDSQRAMAIIRTTRVETADGMMAKRMKWGDDNARVAPQEESWFDSVRSWLTKIFHQR